MFSTDISMQGKFTARHYGNQCLFDILPVFVSVNKTKTGGQYNAVQCKKSINIMFHTLCHGFVNLGHFLKNLGWVGGFYLYPVIGRLEIDKLFSISIFAIAE